jgi:deoxyribodipyrimidine photo-lyase
MTSAPIILWFRQDLRVRDNPALAAAVATGAPIVPVYILDETMKWAPGGAQCWWLHGALESLAADLQRKGLTLILRRGRAGKELDRVIAETGARGVYWNRCYEPDAIARDAAIKRDLKARGLQAESFNGSLLWEPWELATRSGGPFRIFTAFWKAAVQRPPAPPPSLKRDPFASVARQPASDMLAAWQLRPTRPDWAGGLRATWNPGEAGAIARWRTFRDEVVAAYQRDRDRPGVDGTSMLSPYLHSGEISSQRLWADLSAMEPNSGVATFQKELIWREFSYHLLYHFPQMPTAPLRPDFAGFPWKNDKRALKAWQRGRTGYPIVDAGMRQLWQTGWMHNRVRMVVASFLVKHLLQPWQDGAAWFWDTLVDADLANNSASWQWVAGSGMDAAPYFRVFNPVLQGEKFDAHGAYVRRWVPELAGLPDDALHAPWKAPQSVLEAGGVRLGTTYPSPIVDHDGARKRALAAFASLKA